MAKVKRGKKPLASVVPCGTCNLCCRGEVLVLHPECGDRISDYQAMRWNGRWILQHKENGDCIYLDREKGCTIHNRRPAICREFDCRMMALRVMEDPNGLMARCVDRTPEGVFERGCELLKEEGRL